jgi:hypothetical protein
MHVDVNNKTSKTCMRHEAQEINDLLSGVLTLYAMMIGDMMSTATCGTVCSSHCSAAAECFSPAYINHNHHINLLLLITLTFVQKKYQGTFEDQLEALLGQQMATSDISKAWNSTSHCC